MRSHRFPSLSLFAVLLLAGCGVSPRVGESPLTAGVRGVVHGGQQPVVGSAIQLYGVGTGGDGTGANPLLNKTVTTDGGGGFDISGAYSCAGVTEVYLTATGGDPGNVGNNPNIAVMAALGDCSSLGSGTFISINEVTTVAAVAALAPYMNPAAASPLTTVASGSNDASALAAAFTLAAELADTSVGSSPGPSIPAGMSVPVAEINTLADILSTCVNTKGGTANDGTGCGYLFGATTISTAPKDTVAALLNIINNPTVNTAAIFALAPANGPFQSMLTSAPTTFAVGLTTPAAPSSTTSITFPATPIGLTADAQMFSLQNSTNGSQSVGSISISGANPGEFAVGNPCGGSLALGAECVLTVTYTPTLAGPVSAVLNLNIGGVASTISLSGTGLQVGPGPLSQSTSSLSWLDEGTAMPVTLTNHGSLPVAISSVSVSGYSTPVNGTFVPFSTCGNSVAAGASCTVWVVAEPYAAGTGFSQTATLNITDGASSTPQMVSLTSASQPYPYNFGYVAVGATSAPYTLTNSSGLTSTSFSFGSPNGSSFTGTGCYNAHGTCYANVYFVPTSQGSFHSSITFTNINTAVSPFWASGTALTTTKSLSVATGSVNLLYPGPAPAITISVLNTSTQSMSLTGATLLGDPLMTKLFNVSLASGCSSLGSNASCLVTVTPLALSGPVTTHSLTLVVTDSSGLQASGLLTVSGTYQTLPAISPAGGYNFGNVMVGSSATTTFTVTRTANEALTATVPVTGMSMVGTPYCAAGTTPCTFTVQFAPTTAGLHASGYFIVEGSITRSPVQVTIQGYGGTPTAVFPTQFTTNASPIKYGAASPMTVQNTGSAPLSYSVAISGPNASMFGLSGGTCGSSIPAGSTCTLQVNFIPTAHGNFPATFTFTTNDPTQPTIVVNVTGYAAGSPNGTFSPASYAFGTVALNSRGSTTVTLNNTGNEDMVISSITAVTQSGIGSPFSVSNTCVSTLQPSSTGYGTCYATITFYPQYSGAFTGQIQWASNAVASPNTMTLTGTGGPGTPLYALNPSPISFPPILNGNTSQTQSYTLTNSGTDTLQVGAMSLSGGTPGDYSASNNCPATLAAAGTASCTITVTNTPSGNSPTTTNLTFASVGSQAGASFPVSSQAVVTGVQLSQSSTVFPFSTSVPTPASQVVYVSNVGRNPVTISGISLGGTSPASYSQTNNCTGVTLSATRQSCSVTITATPSGTSGNAATLIVANSAATVTGTLSTSTKTTMLPSATSLAYSYYNTFQDVTITNYSSAAVTLQYLGITAAGVNYQQGSTCPQSTALSLPAGGSCVVTLSATQPGVSVNLVYQINNVQTTIPITIGSNGYVGNAPTFPSTKVGSEADGTLTYYAPTTTPATFYGYVGLPGASDFAGYANPLSCTGTSSASCGVTIGFTPTATGTRTARFYMSATGLPAASGTSYVVLTGTGTP